MLTIGLTGGVGSGKTTVTRHFSSLGVPVIDADDLARQLVEPGEAAYIAIVEEFGRDILAETGDIDRRKLRQLIFADTTNRVILESILHPLVRQQIQQQIQSINAPYCIVAIPLLIETGQTDIVDRILVVNAPRKAQISRTVARDGVNESDVEAIISAQISNEIRLSMADDVLNNDAGLDDIFPKVADLHDKYLRLAGVEKQVEVIQPMDQAKDKVESDKPVKQQAPVVIPLLDTKNVATTPAVNKSMEAQIGAYELPLNEKMRTFIRLEFLFNEIEHYLKGKSIWDIRSAVNAFIAILNVLGRPELKTDLIKELDRISACLAKYSSHAGVNADALAELRVMLAEKSRNLRNHEGPLGQGLKQNELVTALRQRESIPGGALAMDMPSYAFWLGQSFDQCVKDIRTWLTDFMLVKDAVEIILKLIRDSAVASEAVAKGGFYQHSLDAEASTQIVRIIVPKGVNYFPEISGGRHRFTVRFLKQIGFERPVQADEEVAFKLICCTL